MQPPASNAQHLFTTAQMVYSTTAAVVTGITTNKYLSKIVKAMPPLPPNASWGKQWAYAALKNITEVEPAGKP